jgi:hypothetical protein
MNILLKAHAPPLQDGAEFADSSPEVKQRHAPYPEVVLQNVDASPNLNLRKEGKCHANISRISNLRSLPVY